MATKIHVADNRKRSRLTYSRIASLLSMATALVAGIALIVMLVLVLADVAGRTFFLTPVRGTLEIVSFILLPIVVFGGYALAHDRDQHMRMTLIYDSLQGKASAWNRFAVEVLTVLGTGAMFYFAWIRMERSVSIQEAEIGLIAVPVWPTTIFMTVGLGIFMLQAIAKLISGTKAHLVQPAKEESQ